MDEPAPCFVTPKPSKEEKSLEDKLTIKQNNKEYNFHFQLFSGQIKISINCNDFFKKQFSKNFSFEELVEINKIFTLSKTISEAYEFIIDYFKNKEKEIKEEKTQLILYIKTKEKIVKDIIFKIPFINSDPKAMEDLYEEIVKLKKKEENYIKEIKNLNDKLQYLTGFNFESQILSKNDKDKIIMWLNPEKKNITFYFKLIYRRGENMSVSKFHATCDYQGPTLVVCKAKNEKFGGYTNIDWEAIEDKPIHKVGPFIFSITKNKKFVYKYQNDRQSIYLSKDHGPDFNWDFTFNSPNQMRTCICRPEAYSNESIIGNGTGGDIEVDEVEIFQVKNYII